MNSNTEELKWRGRSDTELSKAVSQMLRHEPSAYGLIPDGDGWVGVQDLIAALKQKYVPWGNLDEGDLQEMVNRSQKRRHEIRDGKIRALYGHSTPERVLKRTVIPPAHLYHGTDPNAAAKILIEGLKPMTRQYVHLSVDAIAAREVGSRKDKFPVILLVDAARAHHNGVTFYEGNESVWLAEYIPPPYISTVTGE